VGFNYNTECLLCEVENNFYMKNKEREREKLPKLVLSKRAMPFRIMKAVDRKLLSHNSLQR
jgi:hypothetical protein